MASPNYGLPKAALKAFSVDEMDSCCEKPLPRAKDSSNMG
ncbi:hypothetical protein CCACVL1_27694 [Corchorus capsularis]|uniref:Uncharacterized protein n=1 Tax=Corchorus capsularis TaxID=210143 RepID=A0A1R3G971_COCAP|nr:hypothetical protein CCACVL1_27694 [Corchorus capsularis]